MIEDRNRYFKNFPEFIAHTYINYCKSMPNHRGKYRVAKTLDNLFNSFELKTPFGPILDIFLSSSMDLSYYEELNISHKNILEIIKQIPQGSIFIDIGANIGFYSIFAATIVGESGRVLCFEPSPREFRRLLKNIQLNHSINLLPYNIALSDYVGESKFFIAESHTGLNSCSPEIKDKKTCISVPVCTGDILLQSLDSNTKKLIKIDVEGLEFSVLSGMVNILRQRNILAVVVEITPTFLANFGHTKDMIYTLMMEHGFTPTISSSDWQYDEVFIR
ncbi:FkbM family methyltransferase [Aetokthonos hydrillicola Thurmond2011]|jgi:FkbM family methyltransferase|uniref:FkbM family methyltransferase n=1 Tax=Aetokthonos hydrillicola Thurmond2011 TaxID=2712845 RepID=A0AAP5IDH9_9CYAN|nr:FkbM family methyltransferase [Aetokthonos hydrillicola]MBO3460286.1 FkbM family methyltransferase [Aetokthonos hydrillicola CCALA 1050]MBW4587616.1 FkbM family methyltransferase [Aetokthonos hydrillicola CCALA 1050]MDR9898002.1 FkbM family methyltransferase [Aetokthonos hydrillicola Thurmond2011]